MRILGDAVAVVVGVCEPPLVPPHQRGVDLRQEIQIPGGLVDLPCGPGRHGRLGPPRRANRHPTEPEHNPQLPSPPRLLTRHSTEQKQKSTHVISSYSYYIT